MTDTKALVLFSGGQDSTACLAWALETYSHVETIGYDFGQRHGIELIQRECVLNQIKQAFPKWRDRIGDDHVLSLSELPRISETALTHNIEIEMSAAGLPTTFVPGRNLLFFTYAAAVAYRRAISTLIGGMCETDFSGYPDCRNETIKALETALSLGMDKRFSLETPLMFLDKAQTWHLIDKLGGTKLVEIVIEDSHTCYLGDRSKRHDWGYGCGSCPACTLRSCGFMQWQTSNNAMPSQASTNGN